MSKILTLLLFSTYIILYGVDLVESKSKGLIYDKDGKFIYRPARQNQGHIIIIDDRPKIQQANSADNNGERFSAFPEQSRPGASNFDQTSMIPLTRTDQSSRPLSIHPAASIQLISGPPALIATGQSAMTSSDPSANPRQIVAQFAQPQAAQVSLQPIDQRTSGNFLASQSSFMEQVRRAQPLHLINPQPSGPQYLATPAAWPSGIQQQAVQFVPVVAWPTSGSTSLGQIAAAPTFGPAMQHATISVAPQGGSQGTPFEMPGSFSALPVMEAHPFGHSYPMLTEGQELASPPRTHNQLEAQTVVRPRVHPESVEALLMDTYETNLPNSRTQQHGDDIESTQTLKYLQPESPILLDKNQLSTIHSRPNLSDLDNIEEYSLSSSSSSKSERDTTGPKTIGKARTSGLRALSGQRHQTMALEDPRYSVVPDMRQDGGKLNENLDQRYSSKLRSPNNRSPLNQAASAHGQIPRESGVRSPTAEFSKQILSMQYPGELYEQSSTTGKQQNGSQYWRQFKDQFDILMP